MVTMAQRAGLIAEEVLFPAAPEVDATGVIPPGHFDLLAEQGFYGLVGSAEHGGAEIGFPSFVDIVETLYGACLATTFTWMQHHSVVRALNHTANEDLRDKYRAAAIRGEIRGGVAFAGAIPQPPRLWASATDGGWLISGESPFVTGWGLVDVLLISARSSAGGAEGTIVSGLVDAEPGGGITVEWLTLLAAQGSNTVRLCFADYFLPAEKVTAEVSHAEFLTRQHVSSRLNGCLPMGIAGRCLRLLVDAGQPELVRGLRRQQGDRRERLDAGLRNPETLPAARAAACEFAYRAAGALTASVGSSGICARQHAQRLVREAGFGLVVAGRPEIRNNLLELFGRAPR